MQQDSSQTKPETNGTNGPTQVDKISTSEAKPESDASKEQPSEEKKETPANGPANHADGEGETSYIYLLRYPQISLQHKINSLYYRYHSNETDSGALPRTARPCRTFRLLNWSYLNRTENLLIKS